MQKIFLVLNEDCREILRRFLSLSNRIRSNSQLLMRYLNFNPDVDNIGDSVPSKLCAYARAQTLATAHMNKFAALKHFLFLHRHMFRLQSCNNKLYEHKHR